jgi:hypothetical protein
MKTKTYDEKQNKKHPKIDIRAPVNHNKFYWSCQYVLHVTAVGY